MLADPKAADSPKSFPRQWLQLRRVGMFPPDKMLYPDYDEYLEKSMVAETVGFFGEVLKRNASLREFLDSDWTMLNERLATHYDIAGVHGEAMQRVSLKPEDHRGGLLTQAAILSLTSDGTRHRPVHRGVWVLESHHRQAATAAAGQCPGAHHDRPRGAESHGAREARAASRRPQLRRLPSPHRPARHRL